jgi:phosphatidylserine decarboxylase
MKKRLGKLLIVIGVFIIIMIGFVVYFNRVPERVIPNASVVVSPASGKIIGILPITSDDITFEKKGVKNTVVIPEINEKMTMVLIEMNPLDVHVQRAPIDGAIVRLDHYAGKHINAIGNKKMDIVNTNEKTVAVFSNETETIAVIQVAGKAARRIRNYVTVQNTLEAGSVYGRIILGSQVVVLIPESREINVTLDQKVIDGETILAQ